MTDRALPVPDHPQELIEDNYWLRFFFRKERPLWVRLLLSAALFYAVPTLLVVIAWSEDVLMLAGSAVGLLEDYLFLSFAFLLAPLIPCLLFGVLISYLRFLRLLPRLSRLSSDENQLLLVRALDAVISRDSWPAWTNIKVFWWIVALVSNMTSVYRRADGWNSWQHHPVTFGLEFLYLAVVAWILLSLVVRFLLVVSSQTWLTIELAERDALIVRPLAPDHAAGLSSLGGLCLHYCFFVFPVPLTIVAAVYTLDTLTPGLVLGFVVAFPLSIGAFFVPLYAVHKLMSRRRLALLTELSDHHRDIGRRLLHRLRTESGDQIHANRELLGSLEDLHTQISSMPVWPFDLTILTRVLGMAFGPLTVVLLHVYERMVVSMVLG